MKQSLSSKINEWFRRVYAVRSPRGSRSKIFTRIAIQPSNKSDMKIAYYKSATNNQWYFRLVSRNGQKIAQSEGYHRKTTMLKTIEAIKTKSFGAKVVEVSH